jgi:glycerol-3-phosphate dehydrogenase
VAEKVVKQIFEKSKKLKKTFLGFERKSEIEYGIFSFDWDYRNDANDAIEILKTKIKNESVVHLQDLIVRRTTIGDNPYNAIKQAKEIAKLFKWDQSRIEYEINDLKKYFSSRGFSVESVNNGNIL